MATDFTSGSKPERLKELLSLGLEESIEDKETQPSSPLDLFIEKPLSHNLENVNELIRLKEENNLVVMVGYNQRFNIGLKKL